MKTTAAEMTKAEKEFAANGDAAAKEAKEIKLLEQQLQLLIKKQQTAQQALGNATATYGENSVQASKWRKTIVESETAVSETKNRLAELKSGLTDAGEASEDAAAGMDKLSNSADACVIATQATVEVLKNAYLAAARKTAEVMRECVDASVEFESAITGVYKTVDGTDEQLAAISEGVRDMAAELPEATEELAATAESAGQLGIKTNNILSFARVMTMLGTTTDMSANRAATSMARFTNITGTAAGNYGRLGSVVVALGNNFATTESEITEMAQRLASAGTLAGLSEPEIMALAAAMSSVGIEAEAGGTAMTQTLNAIEKAAVKGGEDLQALADIAGMSSEEFAKTWGDAPAEAISRFILGLGELENKGESSVLVLDELGLSGINQSNMLRSLALAGDQLTGAVSLANTAWAENNALTNEAAQRYATTESKLQLAENAQQRLAAAYGSTLTPAVKRFAEAQTKTSNALAKFIEQCPEAGQAATATGAAVLTLGAGFGALGIGNVVKNCEALTRILKLMTAAIRANPTAQLAVGAAAGAAALATFALTAEKAETATGKLIEQVKQAKKTFQEAKEATNKEAAEIGELASRMEYLQAAADGGAAGAAALKTAQEQLVEALPRLSAYIDEETGLLAENWQQTVQNELAVKAQTEAWTRQAEIGGQLAEVQNQLAEQRAVIAEYDERDLHGRGEYERYTAAREAAQQLAQTERALLAEQEALSAEYGEYTAAAKDSAEATDSITQKVQAMVDKLNAMAVAYDEAKAAALESLDSQVGLFDEMKTAFDSSAADLERALESQQKYLKDYAENLQKAMNKGVDTEILDQLADGSVESAEKLAALASATVEQIDRINAKYAESEAAKDYLASTLAAYKTGSGEVIAEAEGIFNEVQQAAQMGDEMAQAGADALQGFINGAKSKLAEGTGTMTALADAMLAAWRAALDEHSPSREFGASGQNSMQGYIGGAKGMAGELNRELAEIAKEGFASFDGAASTAAAASGKKLQAEFMAAWKKAQATSNDFDKLRKALDNAQKADVFDEETYYKKLAALREKYLSPDDDEYAQVGLELYSYTQELLEAENKALDDACNDFIKSYEDSLQMAADAIKERVSDIKDAYDDLLTEQQSMQSRLADYGDLFKTVSLSYSDGSSGEYYRLGDLEAQIDALREYRQVLDDLRGRGLSDSLMSEVTNLGLDDAVKYGRELLQKSDKEWAEYNRQWEEKQKLAREIAENFYKDELAALEDEYAAELREGLDSLKNIGYDSGGDIVGGIISGMGNREGDLRREMQKLADAMEQELRESLDMHSPSRRLENLGELAGESLPLGFAKGADRLRDMIADAVPGDLSVNYAAQTGYKRDGNIVNALGTLFSGGGSGDLTVILRGGSDIEFARAVLPAFRRAAAENPIVEVDF